MILPGSSPIRSPTTPPLHAEARLGVFSSSSNHSVANQEGQHLGRLKSDEQVEHSFKFSDTSIKFSHLVINHLEPWP